MNSKYTGLQVEALLDKVQGQYTKEEINALIGNYEKKAWMGTSAQYNALEQIEEDRMYLITDGTAPDGSNIVDLTQYYTKDEINELLTSKANTAHTHTLSDITDYTAPTYKTINGQSILGEGNITIEGGSGGASYDDTELRELINGKANIEHTHTLNDITDYTAPTYKTINGQSILGEGDIVIEGGSGGVDKESIDSIEKTVSSGLYDLNSKIKVVDSKFGDRYTKKQSDGKYQPKGNYLTAKSLIPYYTSDYIDSKLMVISAALNELSERIAALETIQ